MNVHRHRIVGKLVGIDQTTRELVVGVCREPVTREELGFGIECFRIALDQAVNLGARRFRPSHRVGSSQRRNVLSERMTGNEAVEITSFQAETGQVVPAAHIFPGGR